jgi:uncharacterized protein YndB with AHSA1/START domain
VQELWDLWTTRDGFESWWAPEGCRAHVRTIEAREGGELHYEMIADTPEMIASMEDMGLPVSHLERARFSVFQPMQRLVLRLMIDFVPRIPPYESTLMVDFFPSGEHVRMVVTLLPMHDEPFTAMAKQGLESQLRNLDRVVLSRYH